MSLKNHKYIDYVCPQCFNQLPNCTCKFDSYNLIMIDNEIQYAIRELNKKNIYTETCCGGHYNNEYKEATSTYISFTSTPKTMPKNWKRRSNTLYYKFNVDNVDDFDKEKIKAINELNNWVDGL